MYPELTQFNDWLACQYSNSSTRKHYMSDLVLFFSWAKEPPEVIASHHVDKYINLRKMASCSQMSETSPL